MQKPHYDIELKEIDLILFAKYIDTNNTQCLLDIVFEQQMDIESIGHIARVEYNIQINESKYNNCVKAVNDIFRFYFKIRKNNVSSNRKPRH